MAEYPGEAEERRLPAAALHEAVRSVFEAAGMHRPDAELLAGSLVAADARGIHSHGTLRVPEYVVKLTTGGVDPRGRPRVAGGRGAGILVDGGNAMGQVVAAFAMDRAVERASELGVGLAAVRGSNHCGAMDHWAMRAEPRDMIGIAMTNALPTMAPWGGVERIVGINPLAVCLPAAEEPAVVLDIAFGATAHGKIRVYDQKGYPIPEGWAFDAEGHPTTDAAAAMKGLIQPIGGHKGVGMGIIVGLLSTLLSGAAYGPELGDMEHGPRAGQDGHLFIAIDIASFQPPAAFRARVDGLARQIRDSRRRDGVARLYPPGLLEHEFAEARARDGIPLNAATIAGIQQAGRRFGLDLLSA